jgi:hypothetical protein
MDHHERNRLDYETQQILAELDRQREKEKISPLEWVAVALFAFVPTIIVVAVMLRTIKETVG